MPYSTWRDDSGDEWQQALILRSVPFGAGSPSALGTGGPDLAEHGHSAKTSGPRDTQLGVFSAATATF